MNLSTPYWVLVACICVLSPVVFASESLPISVPDAATSASLRVVAPDGQVTTRRFESAAALATSNPQTWVSDAAADGLYRYEIQFGQTLPAEIKAAATAARQHGATGEIKGLPEALRPVSDSFRIVDGAVVAPSASEPERAGAPMPESVLIPTDQVIADDLIVQSSLCVGFDCVNNEVFDFDTIRMKENNTRIKFEDTSVGSFAGTDWQLTANDSSSGALNKFSIEDVTAATVPFTIEGAAPSNALYVDANGDVGLGTAVPILKLHLNDSDSPAIRLEQNGSGGWTPQTWDVAGNEANFFVRDVTNGSLLPFRIRPGAPTSSIDIAATGNVGIGTDNPQAKLHVDGDAYVAGTLTQLSSRSAKTNLVAVASDTLLEKLASLPLWTWNYLRSDASDRHIGPVAEDFYASFGFGTSQRHLAPSDVAGVALAATKALQQQLAERDRTIEALETRLARIEALLRKRSAEGNAVSVGP